MTGIDPPTQRPLFPTFNEYVRKKTGGKGERLLGAPGGVLLPRLDVRREALQPPRGLRDLPRRDLSHHEQAVLRGEHREPERALRSPHRERPRPHAEGAEGHRRVDRGRDGAAILRSARDQRAADRSPAPVRRRAGHPHGSADSEGLQTEGGDRSGARARRRARGLRLLGLQHGLLGVHQAREGHRRAHRKDVGRGAGGPVPAGHHRSHPASGMRARRRDQYLRPARPQPRELLRPLRLDHGHRPRLQEKPRGEGKGPEARSRFPPSPI